MCLLAPTAPRATPELCALRRGLTTWAAGHSVERAPHASRATYEPVDTRHLRQVRVVRLRACGLSHE